MNKSTGIKVCFSIISHNQYGIVANFLASLEQHLVVSGLKLFVNVTHNTNEPFKFKKYEKFEVRHIQNLREKGFGENQNAVFERYQPQYFFIVNPDIMLFSPLDLKSIIRKIPSEGICSAVILNQKKEREDFCRADLTIRNLLLRVLNLEKDIKKWDWMAGMFLMVSGNHFRKLKGFDTKFYLYVEDCDLCVRSKYLGGQLIVFENLRVIHDAQRNSRKNWRFLRWHIQSLLYYWKKRYWTGMKND